MKKCFNVGVVREILKLDKVARDILPRMCGATTVATAIIGEMCVFPRRSFVCLLVRLLTFPQDCTGNIHVYDRPSEPSAFSSENISVGPFANITTENAGRGPRIWEADSLPDGFGESAPQNVGREGRRKQIERLEKRERDGEEEDPEDWFGQAGRGSGGKKISRDSGGTMGARTGRSEEKRMNFAISLKGAAQKFQPSTGHSQGPGPPSLLDRLGDSYERAPRQKEKRPNGSNQYHRNAYHGSGRNMGGGHYRERERERDRNRDREHGPRYQGGYSR